MALQGDGHATRHIVVPGGLNGQTYDEKLTGTWAPREPDSLVVVLTSPGVTGEGDTVSVEPTLPFAVRSDTLRTEWFGTNETHEVIVLVRR